MSEHEARHRAEREKRDYDDDYRPEGAGDQGHAPDFEPTGHPRPGSGDQGHAPDFSQPGMPHAGAGDQGHPPAFHHQDDAEDEQP